MREYTTDTFKCTYRRACTVLSCTDCMYIGVCDIRLSEKASSAPLATSFYSVCDVRFYFFIFFQFDALSLFFISRLILRNQPHSNEIEWFYSYIHVMFTPSFSPPLSLSLSFSAHLSVSMPSPLVFLPHAYTQISHSVQMLINSTTNR